jgi:hypothetical protein
MDREQVLACLREHETELKDAGLLSLSLFGSTARICSLTSTEPGNFRCSMSSVLKSGSRTCWAPA